MGMSISVQISGADEIIDRLSEFSMSLYMFDEAFKEIGESIIAYVSGQVFGSQGGILGEDWPDLSPEYAEWKAINFPGAGPLIRTGSMQESFYYDATENSLTIGNTAEYFIYHQSSEAREKIPRRVMLAINDDIKGIISYLMDAHITRKLQGAGF